MQPLAGRAFSRLERISLDAASWVDYGPGWVQGSDALFEEVLRTREWGQHLRWMYKKRVLEPRLTAPWSLHSGAPLQPEIIDRMRLCLSERYGVLFDSVGFNLYRDGQDSVAWHSDKILPEIVRPTIALVSLGEPRKFLLRSKGGGASFPFQLGRGDLLVTGGEARRLWEHTVPKVGRAGPRISLAFRHGLDPRALLPNVLGAHQKLEQLLSEKWLWGILPHNCANFVEQILEAGGTALSIWSNCPAWETFRRGE